MLSIRNIFINKLYLSPVPAVVTHVELEEGVVRTGGGDQVRGGQQEAEQGQGQGGGGHGEVVAGARSHQH